MVIVLILSFFLITNVILVSPIISFSPILFFVSRIVDQIIENSFSFTRTEQFSLVYGIKIMILSERMLFFACFWCMIDFRSISNAYCLFFCFPLLSSYSFAIPYSNVILLPFSSLPIQSASIFYKIGLFNFILSFIANPILLQTGIKVYMSFRIIMVNWMMGFFLMNIRYIVDFYVIEVVNMRLNSLSWCMVLVILVTCFSLIPFTV